MLLWQKEIVNQLKELEYYYNITYSDQNSVVFVDDLDDVVIIGNCDDRTITITNSFFNQPHIPTKVLSLVIEFVELGEEKFWETLPVDTKVLVSDEKETYGLKDILQNMKMESIIFGRMEKCLGLLKK